MEELREREIALLNDEVEVGKKKRMAELSKKDAIWQNLVLSHMRSLLIYIYIYILILTPTYVTSNLMEKYKLYRIQNIYSGKLTDFLPFAIDNIYYVNFRI